MEKGLNFRTFKNQEEYFKAYDESLSLFAVPVTERYVTTAFGRTHVLCCGENKNPPLVLLHAASCGSTVWYPNVVKLSQNYCIFAIDLISESSKSILTRKLNSSLDNAEWLHETINGLSLKQINLCGLSIGGWTAVNYAGYFPDKILRLILLSPIQTFSKMYASYFFKIMKMGFHPTRENVERYIGWGSEKEAPLPDSIIRQFTISVMNVNSNASFPKWIGKKHLKKLNMPVLLLFGKNEFAFSVPKACKRAEAYIAELDLEVVENASHLLSVSTPDYINYRILKFMEK